MAVVPTFVGPSSGADLGDLLLKGAALRSQGVGSQLEAYSDIFRGLMSNADKIAEISGSDALDRIAQSMAGAKGQLFGGDYATAMDNLRQATGVAKLGAINRSNMPRPAGGGGGGGASGSGIKQKASEWIVRNRDTGAITTFDPADQNAAIIAELRSGGGPLEVLQYGAAVDPSVAAQFEAMSTTPPPTLPSADATSKVTKPTVENGGLVEYGGVLYDMDGNVYDG